MHQIHSLSTKKAYLFYDEVGMLSATEEFDKHMYSLAFKHLLDYY